MGGVVGCVYGGGEISGIREAIAWTRENFPRMAFTPAEIIAASADWPDWDGRLDLPGIYFLQGYASTVAPVSQARHDYPQSANPAMG